MCAQRRASHARPWTAVAVLAVTALLTSGPLGLRAGAAPDPRLLEAQERRRAIEERLDEAIRRLNDLEARTATAEAELRRLRDTQKRHAAAAQAATAELAERLRITYQQGATDPVWSVITADDIQQASEQARLLGLLASQSRGEYEAAANARTRTAAMAEQVAAAVSELDDRRGELGAARRETAALLKEAEREEVAVRATIAAEREEARRRAEEARRAAAEREAQQRVSRDAGRQAADASDDAGESADEPDQPDAEEELDEDGSVSSAPSSGGIACPVGQPRSYSDTFGAPRSGGRAHMGTDILSPHGTPIYAYEDATISRVSNNGLGGISLYLSGASGNTYYYTHLSGYVSGMHEGMSVAAGEHIAYNGDTGNAAGIPHLHFEVMPGGGGNVDPYPYVLQACG